jgi:hypothetical protein
VLQAAIAHFVVYVAATAWQARRALSTQEPAARLREAKRLLAVSAAGPIVLVILILAV